MAEPGEPITLNFGEWLPDQPQHLNPGAILAKNCIPEEMSYRSQNGLQEFSGPLSAMARSSFWIRASTSVVFNFVGDISKLYLFDGVDTYDDVSQAATVYNADTWDFVNFLDRVIATDGSGVLQYYDCGISSTFLDLPGSPPRSKCVGVVRDFVMLGNYVIGSEEEAGGFAWCGFNNTELWTPSLSTQSQRRRSRGNGGAVQRIVSGQAHGVGFRQDDILKISYVGPPNVFRFDDITILHGTPAKRSVCWSKDFIFYLSIEGFKRINRNTFQIDDIGAFRVDQWFKDNVGARELINTQGTVDRRNKLVYWVFKSSSSSTTFDRMLVFNWAANGGRGKWAYAELEVELIGEFASVGYNLDTIGAVLGGNIDSASIPVDSEAFAGGTLALLGFNTSHEAGTFDGAALTAEIDTKEWSSPAGRQYIKGLLPLVEATGSPTIQLAPVTRNVLSENPVTGSFVNLNAGVADVRVDAHYHRYRVKIAGGFTHAVGVQFGAKVRGRRGRRWG